MQDDIKKRRELVSSCLVYGVEPHRRSREQGRSVAVDGVVAAAWLHR